MFLMVCMSVYFVFWHLRVLSEKVSLNSEKETEEDGEGKTVTDGHSD